MATKTQADGSWGGYKIISGEIRFDNIEQLGTAMLPNKFTAPYDGIYLFTFTANSGDHLWHNSPNMPNTKIIIKKWGTGPQGGPGHFFTYTVVPDLSPEFNKHISWVWMDELLKNEMYTFEVTAGYLHVDTYQPVIFTAEYTGYVNYRPWRPWGDKPCRPWVEGKPGKKPPPGRKPGPCKRPWPGDR